MEWIKYSLVYTADSIRKFDSKSNRTADSIRDSIRTQKTIRRSLVYTAVWEMTVFVYSDVECDEDSSLQVTMYFTSNTWVKVR